jgi:hypothetical protein
MKAGLRYGFSSMKLGNEDMTCNPEEWDRLVAWVEWQRKEAVPKKAD